jgi:hypothetical protein
VVTDASGNALSNSLVLQGPTEYVLAGDINRDRFVNGSDFAILAGNFGKSGRDYSQGDLTGDGLVNGSDFAILAGRFGRSLPAVQAASVAPAGVVLASTDPSPRTVKATHRPQAPRRRARPVGRRGAAELR